MEADQTSPIDLELDRAKHEAEPNPKAERDLLWKIDIHIIPWLTLLYLFSFLDRSAIGNAKLYNLEDTLGLTGNQYNIALLIFFAPYAILEPFSNVVLRKLRPIRWIPFITILWGISMLSMAFVKDYAGMLTTRFFLGFFEAGLFPGVTYYISCWYRREEVGIRIAGFFSAAALSGSFGGLLAAGLNSLHGKRNLEGWRWIFLLEGMFTIIFGLASFWLVQDFPDRARFLTQKERRLARDRIKEGRLNRRVHEEFDRRVVRQVFTDPKTYMSIILQICIDGPLYGFSLFMPSIIQQLGYKPGETKAQLLTVAPYFVASISAITVGYLTDRTAQRGFAAMATSALGVIGFAVLLATGEKSPGVGYFATFLIAVGIYSTVPTVITWVSNNTDNLYKRAIVMGLALGGGNLNGMVGSIVYVDKNPNDPGGYQKGHAVLLGYLSALVVAALVYRTYLSSENGRKARAMLENPEVLQGAVAPGPQSHAPDAESQTHARQEDLGDRRIDFPYIL